MSEAMMTADDVAAAYESVGVRLEDLPYTPAMDRIAEELGMAPIPYVYRWIWNRLRELEKAGALPRIVGPYCHACGRSMQSVSGGIGNVTHDGKLWCGCTPAQAGGGE